MRLPRLLTWTLCLLPLVAAHAGVRTEQAVASLLSERSALVVGETAWLGLRIQHDPHWHTYWVNPGDSGLATRLTWKLPDGLSAGEILWPRPIRIQVGPLTNFGYEGDLLLPVPLQVPASWRPGDEVTIALRADWLICEEICIPDGADFTLRIPVAESAAVDARWQALFETARSRVPLHFSGEAGLVERDNDISITVRDPPARLMAAGSRAELFPVQAQIIENGRGMFQNHPDRIWFATPRSAFFAGFPDRIEMLVAAGPAADDPAWLVQVIPVGIGTPPVAAATAPAVTLFGLAGTLLLAFAGGILLNLMPCVFPILSMKALGLVESSADPARLRRHGWIYTLGVLLGFAVVAGALLAVRAGGEAAGWGFQLQQPWFVGILAYVIFVLALSLSGALTLGTSLMGLGQQQAAHGGDRGAFMTGVLACVVASPCTAPFMGTALGFAVTLPAAAAMAVFLTLGFGLAFPLLMISLVPALSRWLPRPGRWMETFKQAMAFPLYLTALWLLWVLGRQTDFESAMTALLGMLLIAFALWLWPTSGSFAPAARRVAALLIAGLSLSLVTPLGDHWMRGESSRWSRTVAYSPAALAELRAAGVPILVNMTADWCIACKVNERAALSGESFHDALATYGVSYVVGDWTNSDPHITSYLAAFGRNGVPFYVVYAKGGGEPEVLTSVLTPGRVRDALRRAAAGDPENPSPSTPTR